MVRTGGKWAELLDAAKRGGACRGCRMVPRGQGFRDGAADVRSVQARGLSGGEALSRLPSLLMVAALSEARSGERCKPQTAKLAKGVAGRPARTGARRCGRGVASWPWRAGARRCRNRARALSTAWRDGCCWSYARHDGSESGPRSGSGTATGVGSAARPGGWRLTTSCRSRPGATRGNRRTCRPCASAATSPRDARIGRRYRRQWRHGARWSTPGAGRSTAAISRQRARHGVTFDA